MGRQPFGAGAPIGLMEVNVVCIPPLVPEKDRVAEAEGDFFQPPAIWRLFWRVFTHIGLACKTPDGGPACSYHSSHTPVLPSCLLSASDPSHEFQHVHSRKLIWTLTIVVLQQKKGCLYQPVVSGFHVGPCPRGVPLRNEGRRMMSQSAPSPR